MKILKLLKEIIIVWSVTMMQILFINEVNEKASKYYEEYISLKRTEDHNWDYEHTFKPFFNTIIRNTINGTRSIYWKAFMGLYNTYEYKMKIVQMISNAEFKLTYPR